MLEVRCPHPHIHLEFGFLCPTRRFGRRLRLAMACLAAAGAGAVIDGHLQHPPEVNAAARSMPIRGNANSSRRPRRVRRGKDGATQSLRLKPTGVISAMHPAGRGGVEIADAQHLDVPELADLVPYAARARRRDIHAVGRPVPSPQRRPRRSRSQRTGGTKRRLQRWGAKANAAQRPTSSYWAISMQGLDVPFVTFSAGDTLSYYSTYW